MGKTITEKILARASGKEEVKPGEYIWAKVDGTSGGERGLVYRRLEKLGVEKLFNPERIFVTEDKTAPSPSVEAANATIEMRKFVKKYGITHFYEWGRHGIIHELYPQHGYCSPGDFIASIDSHSTSYGCFNVASCPINEELIYVLITGELWLRVPPTIKFELTGRVPGPEQFVVGKDISLKLAGQYGTDVALYKAVEYSGPAVHQLSMASRFTMANMGVEIGAKFAIFPCDDKTLEYLKGKMVRPARPTSADPDARYEAVYTLDVTGLPPYVALPHDPGNTAPIDQVCRETIKIDQAYIGSCTNARMEDFVMAARVLKGRKVHPDVRLICTPASQAIWQQCQREGIWEVLAEAGAVITNSTCGACAGMHMGILGDGEVCISTTNRNFQGRMGSPRASVYLANAATVAASAVRGHIADPRESF